MMELRPFASDSALFVAADDIWQGLDAEDWLEAFAHHPRIGERRAKLQRPGARRLSDKEQAGVGRASDAVRKAMLEGNLEYEARFGHVFLICATGKTGEEMLASLEVRLSNDPATELRVAATEHAQIMRIRLRSLVGTESSSTRASP